MRVLVTCLAVGLLALPLVGCGDDNVAEAACVCEKGKAGETVWCEACNAGYVDGKKTKCKDCYGAMTGGPACAACKPKSEGDKSDADKPGG